MSLTTSPSSLGEALRAGSPVRLIDVRTPAEFREVHVHGAENVPLDRLDASQFDSQQPLYVICKSGARGQMACKKFDAAGVEASNVDGGTQACVDAGLPVVRGKKVMSLERQVRIAAGLLVLTGVVLSLTVHPYLLGISAFVGAGLVFAGITDTCGMGMMLAKMPWNQVAEGQQPTQCCNT